MTSGIVEFIEAQLAEDQAIIKAMGAEGAGRWWVGQRFDGSLDPEGSTVFVDVRRSDGLGYIHLGTPGMFKGPTAIHIARHDPVTTLAQVAFMRRIVELHTTGVYRTYDCSNGDHIQEWQCERANEPYTEHRYCEVCGGSECVEVPLLAGIWAGRPGYKPEWRLP